MWGTALDVRYTMSADALWRAGELIDVQIWPSVLDMSMRYETVDEYQAGTARADAELREIGAFGPEGIADGLHLALRIISSPETQIHARIFSGGEVRRILLARRGLDHVQVLRMADSITIESVSVDGIDSAAQRIVACLGAGDAADVGSVSGPTVDLAARLDAAETSAQYAETLYALGINQNDSMKLGVAFADCQGYTEVVAYESVEGRSQQSSGAVAIYETARGRVVGSPSMSPDGEKWTTLSAGSGHRIKQAIAMLMETLPSGRWMS